MAVWIQVLLGILVSLRGVQSVPDVLGGNKPPKLIRMELNHSSYQYAVNAKFISFSIDHLDAGRLCKENEIATLVDLAKKLSPAEIRLGGESVNFVDFVPATGECSSARKKRATDPKYTAQASVERAYMPGDHLLALADFAKTVNFDLAVAFSAFKFLPNGLWDSSNAHQLLDFADSKRINITSFSVGREPENYWLWELGMLPEDYVTYYMLLRQLVESYPLYMNSRVYGPEVNNLHELPPSNARDFFFSFLKNGASNYINEIGVHHYNCDGRKVTARDFLSPVSMNNFKTHLSITASIIKAASPRPLKVRLTETASCNEGGAPGLATNFLSGFMWLDKLGVASSMGVTRVYRNSFFGGNTPLIGGDMDFPFPDFLISLAFKTLVDGPVIDVTLEPPYENLRVYANCARESDFLSKGDLVFYFLNLGENAINVTTPKFSRYEVKLYLFTPGDEEGMTSAYVRINGKLMVYKQGVPSSLTLPAARRSFPLEIPGRTYGFMTISDTQLYPCKAFTHQPEPGNDVPVSARDMRFLRSTDGTRASSNDASRVKVRPWLSLSAVWFTWMCLRGLLTGVRV